MSALHDEDESQHQKEVSEWVRFGMRLGVSAALHPFEYSKVLIQLGYEPIPAVPGRSILGKSIMVLPNIFQYGELVVNKDIFGITKYFLNFSWPHT